MNCWVLCWALPSLVVNFRVEKDEANNSYLAGERLFTVTVHTTCINAHQKQIMEHYSLCLVCDILQSFIRFYWTSKATNDMLVVEH